MTENIDIRFAATLIIAAVLTAGVTVVGYLISGIVAPGDQFTFPDGMIISLFAAGVFAFLLGFSYWLVGYLWETKQIWNPSPNKPQNKKSHNYSGELKPRQQKAKVGCITGQELFDIRPKLGYNPGKIEDLGLRHFNNNDDWINMKPGKRE